MRFSLQPRAANNPLFIRRDFSIAGSCLSVKNDDDEFRPAGKYHKQFVLSLSRHAYTPPSPPLHYKLLADRFAIYSTGTLLQYDVAFSV